MPPAQDELTVDGLLRNHTNPKDPQAEFQRFFTIAKGINNSAGFRVVAKSSAKPKSGRKSAADLAFVVLVTTFGEKEWPDTLDLETGQLTYYGDNRHPGTATNKTSLGGNALLDDVFGLLHERKRQSIPPFLVFESIKIDGKAHMKFLGLAAPGGEGLTASDDLVSVWRIKDRNRFTNKKARLTILREQTVNRSWLVDLVSGVPAVESPHCPPTWKRWVSTGFYTALEAQKPRVPREKKQQLPLDPFEKEILHTLFEELTDREFEYAAAELVKLMDERFIELEVTPQSRDGGRDVVGHYRVGHDQHQLRLSVFVEAKRWNPEHGVGVKPVARLISRIKHRDLGIFITTSYFDTQVQRELIDDNHPVLLVSGGDIARLLSMKGIVPGQLKNWIAQVRSRVASPGSVGEQSQTSYLSTVTPLRRVAESSVHSDAGMQGHAEDN